MLRCVWVEEVRFIKRKAESWPELSYSDKLDFVPACFLVSEHSSDKKKKNQPGAELPVIQFICKLRKLS